MNKDEVRNLLKEESQKIFDDITFSRILGANRQILLIKEILESIINDNNLTKEIIYNNYQIVIRYFQETRGQNSRAIYNVLQMFLSYIDINLEKDIMIQKIRKGLDSYTTDVKESTDKIVEFALAISQNYSAIMVFDYSSTVNEFIKRLDSNVNIYIPESRALNGGKPFIADAVKQKRQVYFIPDTAVMHFLSKCDAAYIGAETIYPDGTVFNSIGSDILSLCCRHLAKPLYVLSSLIKVDIRPVYGHIRLSPLNYDFKNILAIDWDETIKEKVNFKGVKLVSIKPDLVDYIICEQGIIPSNSIFATAINYIEKLEKKYV